MVEQEIIKKCQQGNLAEFAGLYDKYIARIYRFVYFKTSHRETAEDITSQTFIKALKKIKKFNPEKGSFSAWLYRIARNNVIDYYRRRKGAPVSVEAFWAVAARSDFLEKAENSSDMAQIKKAMRKLNSRQKEVVVLRLWHGMPYKEIARALKTSEGACKMAFVRAIKKLKKQVKVWPSQIYGFKWWTTE